MVQYNVMSIMKWKI